MARGCFALLSMTSHIDKKNGGCHCGGLHYLFYILNVQERICAEVEVGLLPKEPKDRRA